eukprot:COSAG02_NODE_2379_length_8997_cov_13.958193_6_plen_164_part_00
MEQRHQAEHQRDVPLRGHASCRINLVGHSVYTYISGFLANVALHTCQCRKLVLTCCTVRGCRAMNPIPARCLGPHCAPTSATHPFCQPCPLPVEGRDCTSCDDTPDPCFPPPCDESSEKPGHTSGLCSGNFNAERVQPSGPVSIVDSVLIPSHLKPGKYVLGW